MVSVEVDVEELTDVEELVVRVVVVDAEDVVCKDDVVEEVVMDVDTEVVGLVEVVDKDDAVIEEVELVEAVVIVVETEVVGGTDVVGAVVAEVGMGAGRIDVDAKCGGKVVGTDVEVELVCAEELMVVDIGMDEVRIDVEGRIVVAGIDVDSVVAAVVLEVAIVWAKFPGPSNPPST